MNKPKTELIRGLTLTASIMIVAGSMIGSGIFRKPATMAEQLMSPELLLIVWLVAGIVTFIGALCNAEIAGMIDDTGGQYVYFQKMYGNFISYLYGWSIFAVIQTGTIAAVGVAFSKFTAYLIPQVSEDRILFQFAGLNITAAQLLAIAVIVLLTYINTKGIRSGKIIQTSFTLTKLLSLFGLIIFGFIVMKPEIWTTNWINAWDMQKLNPDGTFQSLTVAAALGAVAAAMVGSIFSSDAWNNVTFIAGEIRNPKRNIGLSLFMGTLIVTVIYVLANLVYLAVLPLQEIAYAEKDRVAVAASSVIFGNIGTILIALMIMISTFGCNNGLILAGARVYHTMAIDGLFFKKIATLNKHAVPEFGLWLQCLVASVLCLSGKYGDLLDMISFVVVIFYVLTIIGIYILRIKRPDVERPYKAFGYPFLPAIYILMGISFCTLLIIYKPNFTWPGLIIVLSGVPVYYMWKKLINK